jgi:antitoxin PrlF
MGKVMSAKPKPTSAHRARATNHISSVTSKGQATIPADIRREAGIEAGDKVLFSFENGRIVIEKSQAIDDVWNAGQSAMLGEWNDPDEDVYND